MNTLTTPEINPEESQRTKNSPSLGHHIAFSLMSLVVVVGTTVGTYYWQHNKNKSLQTKLNTAQSQLATYTGTSQGSSSSSQTLQNIHFVQSFGRPLGNGSSSNYDFITKLGVPSFMQAVRIWSSGSNRGPEQVFTNEYNNELGRWIFGNPANNEDNGGGESGISLLAISNDWLNTSGDTDYTLQYNNPLETPVQKAQYISQIKSSTATCAKDPSKGFSTVDGKLAVCYTYNYGLDGYEPSVTISGYGEVQGQPLLFTGLIQIYDTSVGSSDNAQRQVIANAKAGDPPAQTATAQKAIIQALKQTTISTTPAPAIQ